MAKSIFVASGSTPVNDNNTGYIGITGNTSSNTSETVRETIFRENGVCSNLHTYVSTNTTLVNSVVTLRKTNADTALTVTYTSGQTGVKEDTTNKISFINTDKISTKIAVSNDVSGTTTITFRIFGVQFEPSSASITNQIFGLMGSITHAVASATQYMPPNGNLQPGVTENNSKYKCRFPFISSNFYCYILTNNRLNTTTMRVRKNAGNGNQNFSFSAGETGAKEDTTNTDSFSVGDDYNYSITTGAGTETMALRVFSTQINNLTNSFPFSTAGNGGTGLAISFNLTRYSPISGDLFDTSATESENQMYGYFNFLVKELVSYVSANTIATSATVVTVRDNGADSAITVSYAAGETGAKNDSTNVFLASPLTDEINYKIVTPNTSGSITFQNIGCLGVSDRAVSPGGGVAYSGGASFSF